MPNCTTELSDLGLLKRSLLKSSTSDLNQASQERLTRLLNGSEWNEAIEAILNFARNDRIVNRQPIIAALAFSVSCSTGDKNIDKEIRQAIHRSLSSVLRTPDELFQMIHYEAQFSASTHRVSTGRCKRSAISAWYNERAPLNLAKVVTQYRRCCGWTHRDILRLAHVKPNNNGVAVVLKYLTKGIDSAKIFADEHRECDEVKSVIEYLQAVETLKNSHDGLAAAQLIEQHKLMQDHVPTWLSKSKEVWRALLPNMPMLRLINNLKYLSEHGLLDSENHLVQIVLENLSNDQLHRDARTNPVDVLIAMKTYEKGQREKNKKKMQRWKPNKDVLDALETAFYEALRTIESSEKRYLVAIDASHSMHRCSSQISPLVASALMSLILLRKERTQIVALSNVVEPLENLLPSSLLDDVCRQVSELARTDVRANYEKLVIWAAETKTEVDIFVICTDQQGSWLDRSPVIALDRYRESMNRPNTRLVIISLTSLYETIITDPIDSRVIHLAGFDSATPEIIRLFATGQLDSVA